MSEIAEIGEFGLIKKLTEQIQQTNSSTEKGVGDDCAVINPTTMLHYALHAVDSLDLSELIHQRT